MHADAVICEIIGSKFYIETFPLRGGGWEGRKSDAKRVDTAVPSFWRYIKTWDHAGDSTVVAFCERLEVSLCPLTSA